MYYSEVLSDFITSIDYEEIPDDVIDKAKMCIVDSLACSYGASQTITGKSVRKTIERLSGAGDSTILGSGIQASPTYAGYVNGKMANILDFDDTYLGIGHPGATIIGPALAVAEDVNASGQDFLKAVVLGYEISCRIGYAVQPTSERFHKIWGMGCWQTFGAMVVSAVLLKLDKEQLVNAFGIAGANAPVSSMRKTILTPQGVNMVKNNFGFASHTGIMSAYLSSNGFTGPHDIFEGDTGFWRMYGSDQCDFPSLSRELGKEYEIMNIDFKPYSMCRWCQPAVEAGLEIMEQHHLNVSDIQSVKIKVASPLIEEPYNLVAPTSMEDVQFSFPFPFAVAISGLDPGPQWFSKQVLHDKAILDMCRKIVLEHDEEADGVFPEKCNSTVEIIDNQGNQYGAFREEAKGNPAYPMSYEEIESKFTNLVSSVLDKEKTQQLLHTLNHVEHEADFSNIKKLLH